MLLIPSYVGAISRPPTIVIPDPIIANSAVAISSATDTTTSLSGTYSVGSTANWVYVVLEFRWASSSLTPTWTVKFGTTGTGSDPDMTLVGATSLGQFQPHVRIYRIKPSSPGTNTLQVSVSVGSWSAMVGSCIEVQDAHASAPDGSTPTIVSAASAATSWSGNIATDAADSLVLVGVVHDTGSTAPQFTPTNGVSELIDAAPGTASNDVTAFVGSKATDTAGTITLGASWGESQTYSVVAVEVKKAA